MEINEEQAAERDPEPSASVDVAGVEALSDGESEESTDSEDTLVEVPKQDTTTTTSTTTTATDTDIQILQANKETEELLADLFSSPEKPTQAERNQAAQEQEQEHTQVLFSGTDDKQDEMEISQNLKRKPTARVDLRQKFGQAPKPKSKSRSPKHKKMKDKL